MSTQNAKNMTLEEKLVQHIKKTKLMTLIDDEDSVAILVKRAITEALFQTTQVQEPGWNGKWIESDSIVASLAKTLAKEACAVVIKEMLDEIMAREDVRDAIRNTLAAAFPVVIYSWTKTQMERFAEDILIEATNKLMNVVGVNQLKL